MSSTCDWRLYTFKEVYDSLSPECSRKSVYRILRGEEDSDMPICPEHLFEYLRTYGSQAIELEENPTDKVLRDESASV